MSNEQRAPSASPDLSRIAANSMMELVKSIFDAPTMEAGYAILKDWAWQCGHGVPVAMRTPKPAGVIAEIAAERRRQDAKWGGSKHDDEHRDGELALYAALSAIPYGMPGLEQDHFIGLQMLLELAYDFTVKPETDPRKRLIKAGALIAAEIERLDRAALQSEAPTVTIPPENDTPVRCPECNWAGRADELGRGGECGGDETCTGRPAEITSHADMIRAWWDSEGQICGKQLADAGMIAPRPATEAEIADRDLESGDTIWDLTPAGEATLQSEDRKNG